MAQNIPEYNFLMTQKLCPYTGINESVKIWIIFDAAEAYLEAYHAVAMENFYKII